MKPIGPSPDKPFLSVGIAGWSIPKEKSPHFPSQGTHLFRYAQVFPVVEINSSFYRPHRPSTYERWANSTPLHFRFSVKVPREMTHVHRLRDLSLLDRFLSEVLALGEKLGPLLVQLPPSLRFDPALAQAFFRGVREKYEGWLVCEPRHPTWFTIEANELLIVHQVSRVAADPAVLPDAAQPGGWEGGVYFRMHGSPKMYYSKYSGQYLRNLAESMQAWRKRAGEVWCIFDNTAEGAAYANALELLDLLGKPYNP